MWHDEGMIRWTILFVMGVAAALAAGIALGDDPASQLLLERAQRADAFTLGVQQSMENAHAGKLGARERLELETRQRDQRQKQDALFYQQQIQTTVPASEIERRAEAMRAEQDRQDQLSRFRFDAATSVKRKPPAPAGVVAPTIVTAPIPRAPASPAVVAAMPGARPLPPEPLAMIRRVEHDADTLWRAALAGDWNAVQAILGDVRGGVDSLRSDRFKANYAESGGRADALAAILDRLDAVLARAEIELGAGDAHSLMRSANALMLAAAELVPEIACSKASGCAKR